MVKMLCMQTSFLFKQTHWHSFLLAAAKERVVEIATDPKRIKNLENVGVTLGKGGLTQWERNDLNMTAILLGGNNFSFLAL